MTSTTGTTTTSGTRTNKRSTSRITGLKAVSEQQSTRPCCNSGARAQLTTPLRNLQPPRGVRCRMSECRSKEELAPPAEEAPSLRPHHPIW
jgi:hypothetical protein